MVVALFAWSMIDKGVFKYCSRSAYRIHIIFSLLYDSLRITSMMLMRLANIAGPDRVACVLCGVVQAFARSTFCATSCRETLLICEGYGEPISAW
jgi:hypothetical protein